MSTMRVISASRRTDIPAFYGRWFMNRLRAGYCHWMNPFGGQVYRTSLASEDVIALVLWTRDPRPLVKHLGEMDELGFLGKYYFHVTVNDYPRSLDPHVAGADAVVTAVRDLAAEIGSERVIWRYDPLLLTIGEPFTGEWHIERFRSLAERLEGATRSCYFSFATYYGKTGRRLDKVEASTGMLFDRDPSLEERLCLVNALVPIAAKLGIQLYSCCGPEMISSDVKQGHCIDADLVRSLRSDLDLSLAAAPSRKGCGCFESTDIGAFDSCLFGCEYCYATVSHAAAKKRHHDHDPDDTILWRPSTMRESDLEALAVELKPGKSKVTPSQGQQESLL